MTSNSMDPTVGSVFVNALADVSCRAEYLLELRMGLPLNLGFLCGMLSPTPSTSDNAPGLDAFCAQHTHTHIHAVEMNSEQ